MAGQDAAASPPAVDTRQRRVRRSRLTAILTGLVVLGVAGAIAGWWWLRPPLVSVAVARRGEAVEAVYASGVVDYVRQARIAPVVTAPIRDVLAVEGQDVAGGQPLAQLEDGPQLGTTLQLDSQAALARAAAERATRLYRAGFGARATFEDAQKTRAAAEAAAASARARLGDWRIVAPFAGRVLRRDAEPGDLATVGTPLFVVADLRSLRITADIDERDVGRLTPGLAAVVRADAFPGKTFTASVTEITPQGDASGRVFRARLALAADSLLRPGMTVEANLIIARRPGAVLAPSQAVQGGAAWVVDGERVRRRAVTVGVEGAGSTEIRSGVAAGERLVLSPPPGLKDGDRIRIAPR